MNIPALQTYFWCESTRTQQLGIVDCVKFVVGAVFVGWDRDYRDILQYSDRRSAINRLRELGGLKEACIHAMGQMHPVDELVPGDVIWIDSSTAIGLLMEGYVAVKAGRQIHRYQIDPEMTGWKT